MAKRKRKRKRKAYYNTKKTTKIIDKKNKKLAKFSNDKQPKSTAVIRVKYKMDKKTKWRTNIEDF